MHTTTKGAVAAGAAAVLLLGGAGSLAYWNSSATLNGGSITTGSLKLTGVSCDASWKYANGSSSGANVVQGIVPGDSITKSCTFTVAGSGDHLTATPTVPSTLAYTTTTTGGAPAPTTLSLPVTATYDLDGTALTSSSVITELDTGKTLTAKIVVTMPFGNAQVAPTGINFNDTQGLTNTLNGLTVTLTQTSPAGGENPNA